MLDENLIRLSKTISHALRHKPEEYGLILDAEGWVESRICCRATEEA